MPTQPPSLIPQNSASNDSLPASGKSRNSAVQIPLFSASNDSLPASGKIFHKVRVYYSKGIKYYRYTCTCGHDIMHDEHIPGGNVRNPIAQARARQVRKWIQRGKSPDAIVIEIHKWRARSR